MAKITAEEYAKVKQATSKYTDEQKQQIVDAYKSGGVSAAKKAIANQTTPSTPVETPRQETTPTTPTPQETPTTPKQETPTTPKVEETPVNTVTEVKQEGALKPLSQEYYNQTSQEAQDKIVANLNGYRQTNPEYFSSYEDFKKNFSYDSRNEQQKNTLDQWYKGYTKGMELSGLPVTDLYTQWKDGTVSNSDLENLRISNPGKYTELQNTINKGNIIAAYDDDKGGTETGMSIQDMAYQMMVQTFNQYMNGDSSSGASQFFRDYEAKMNDPEMLGLSDQCTEIQENMENIQSDLDAIKKTVEAEYEGTGASRAKINAIISDRSYDLQLQLRTLNSEYNKYATQYNNRMNQYQNEFNLQLQEYQLQQTERQNQMKELGFAMDLMSFETPEQAQEREWNYWVRQQEYTNGNINSKDYQTRYKAALKSVENLLSQYEGIPMIRSAEQMADDILKAIDNGSDLGTELTKINQQIQSKDEYKQLYNATYGTSNSGLGKTFTLGDTEYVIWNDQIYTADEFNKQFGNGTKANYNIVSEDVLKTYSDGRAGTFGSFMAKNQNADGNYIGQCGKFVNNYLQEIGAGRPFGNEDINTREGWINSDEGKVGTIAVFDYNHYINGKNYGHVGIVISAPDKNGDFWVKDANFDSDGKIQTRKVNLKDASLKGFIDPSLSPDGTRTTSSATLTSDSVSNTKLEETESITSNISTNTGGITSPYIESEVGLYDAYINNGTTPTDAKLKSLGDGDLQKGWQVWNARVQDYMNKTGAGTLEKKKNDEINKLRTEMHQQDAYKDYSSMKGYYEKIKNATNNETATAASDVSLLFAYMKMLDPKSIVRESEFATAQNMGSLPTKWHAQLKSAVNGKKLTDSQRTEILNETKTLMDSATYLYNNLLDDYTSMINYGGDASKLGKKGEYITDDYKNQYGTSGTESTPQTTNFYQKYANTAPGAGKKRPFGTNSSSTILLSDGQSFQW